MVPTLPSMATWLTFRSPSTSYTYNRMQAELSPKSFGLGLADVDLAGAPTASPVPRRPNTRETAADDADIGLRRW